MCARLAGSLSLLLVLGLAACATQPQAVAFQPSAAPSRSPTPEPSRSAAPMPPPLFDPPDQTPSPTATSTAPGRAGGVGPGGSMVTTGSNAVALTFDDGPHPTYTPALLDALATHQVKATFCMVGNQAASYPELVRRIYDEGHTLCNHSDNHADLSKLGLSEVRKNLQRASDKILAAVPGAEIKYFRAPYGAFTTDIVEIAADMGMTSLYWHVDTKDWDSSRYGTGKSMVDHIVKVVQGNTRLGSMVLAHDRRPKLDTVNAFKILLPWLKERFTLIALPPEGYPVP